MQSAYVLGMAILSMAIAPKMLEAMTKDVDRELGIALSSYTIGVTFNWLFALILWHYYWGMEMRQEEMRERRESDECSA